MMKIYAFVEAVKNIKIVIKRIIYKMFYGKKVNMNDRIRNGDF